MPKTASNAPFSVVSQLPELPEGWSLSEREGNSKVSLTRELGDEAIQVDFVAREYVSLSAA